MRMGLIGYGKMGKAIQKIALERNHSIITIDPVEANADFKEINSESLNRINVCIDFTVPDSAIANVKKVSSFGKNLVMGTTEWYSKMSEMQEATKEIGFLWSGNFSVGMNVFFEAVKKTARIMNQLPDYDSAVCEIHHNQKKDSPGGSAQIIGNIIIKELERKNKIVGTTFSKRKPLPEELHIASMRCSSIPGTHTVYFDSIVDTIELKHTARGREGFALGALMAAEFINGKKGFFGMQDFMKTIIKD